MRRILVVGNRTLCEQHLLDAVHERRTQGPATFHVLVPASHPSGAWSDIDAEEAAQARLDEMLDTLAAAGVGATGEVGDASPVLAVTDLLRRESFDEIIVSTLPVGMSRWLANSVVRRLRTQTGLPVTHVVAERAPVDA